MHCYYGDRLFALLYSVRPQFGVNASISLWHLSATVWWYWWLALLTPRIQCLAVRELSPIAQAVHVAECSSQSASVYVRISVVLRFNELCTYIHTYMATSLCTAVVCLVLATCGVRWQLTGSPTARRSGSRSVNLHGEAYPTRCGPWCGPCWQGWGLQRPHSKQDTPNYWR